MAVGKLKKQNSKVKTEEVELVPEALEVKKEERKDDELFGGELDPKEEKMLDRILMVIVWFILGWLGLSVILVLRGYVCSEVLKGAFFCAGL